MAMQEYAKSALLLTFLSLQNLIQKPQFWPGSLLVLWYGDAGIFKVSITL